MFRHIPANTGDGQFHGAEFVFGSVAQQFQFGGVEIEERGMFYVLYSVLLLASIC